jgi:hypothetical protein
VLLLLQLLGQLPHQLFWNRLFNPLYPVPDLQRYLLVVGLCVTLLGKYQFSQLFDFVFGLFLKLVQLGYCYLSAFGIIFELLLIVLEFLDGLLKDEVLFGMELLL